MSLRDDDFEPSGKRLVAGRLTNYRDNCPMVTKGLHDDRKIKGNLVFVEGKTVRTPD